MALLMVEHSVISCYYSDNEAVKVRISVHSHMHASMINIDEQILFTASISNTCR